jgi:hypothetical protein
MEVLNRAVRPFVIVLGFLSSLVGTLGSFLIIERVNVSIRKGNLLDRAEPVRNVIAALALNRLLDYQKTYGEYERLVEAAQKDTNFKAFMAVKLFERQVVEQAQDRVTALQTAMPTLQQQISRAEAQLRARQVFLIAFSSVGAFLLLLANLFEHGARSRPPAASSPTPATIKDDSGASPSKAQTGS